jgi:hypothetical protein
MYNFYITLLCSTFEELKELKIINNTITKTLYEWMVEQCLFNNEYKTYILNGLSLFFKEKVSFNGYVFYLGEVSEKRYLNEEIFNHIQKVLKKICCVENIQEDIENPANSKARELLEKRKKYRQKLKKAKQNGDEEPLTLRDLISIYCTDGNGASILNVGQFTMYQFNDQFNRMTMLQDYNVNIQALLHGGSSNEELKSWMRKIKTED